VIEKEDAMPVVRAEELTYTAIRGLDMSRAVCFLPVSALEVHGPHLPLGMDFYMARWMAEETGRRFADRHPDWTVIQYPPLPLGTDELPLAGSMNVDQRTVFEAVRRHGDSLARAGFRYVVVTNGHGGPRHASALEAACRRVSRKRGIQMFTPSIAVLHALITGKRFAEVETLLGRSLSADEREGLLAGEHAGGWETAFMLVQQPELIERDWRQLGLDRPPTFRPLQCAGDTLVSWLDGIGRDTNQLREIVGGLAGGVGWMLNAHYGHGGHTVSYAGNPSIASQEIGQAFREVMVRDCLDVVERITAGALPASEVRSIASDAALIQPYFLWKLAAAGVAAVALLAWIL
jgi:creatinine amidohydrolase